jgi:hypothetical protein
MIKLKHTAKSIAEQRNELYNQKESHWVALGDRIDALIKVTPSDKREVIQAKRNNLAKLTDSLGVFDRSYPGLTWAQVCLAKAKECSLSDIVIDDTMNRPLVWHHVMNIIQKFKQTKIMSINVYEDKTLPGKYVAWDGQHTAVVLYLLSVRHMDKLPEDIRVPITIYPTDNKAEIRENFEDLNTTKGKEPLSPFALFRNKIFGVRIDGSNNPAWEEANQKQIALTAAGLFLTEETYESTYEGALTHIEIIDHTSLALVKNFCTYWNSRQGWPDKDAGNNTVKTNYVEGKELILVMRLFALCAEQHITVDTQYIDDMVEIMYRVFRCNWNAQKHMNPLFEKIDKAYCNWFEKKYLKGITYPSNKEDREVLGIPERLKMANGSSNTKKQDPYFIAFIIAQLNKSGFKHTLPKVDAGLIDGFKPAISDLW